MEKFTRNLITEWRKLKLPTADRTFVVAVSGGADSVSLMLALNDLRKREKLNLRFVVAHFNHNLRDSESETDAEFVRHLTTKLDFELVCQAQTAENNIKNQKGNLEQNARNARYEFLAETARNLHADGVLTAHTLNDQAETFLINLIRGSGLDGLGAMSPIRNLATENPKAESANSEIKLIRPFLNWAKREDTENFCHRNEIEFRFDAMNEDLKFSRVRIRKILLPMLRDLNPKIVETLAKTANLLRETNEHLTNESDQLISCRNIEPITEENDKQNTKHQEQKNSLFLKDLIDVFPAMRRVMLRDWLKDNRGNLRRLELKHIEAIENLIFSRKSGKVVELPNGEIVVKNKGKLHFERAKVEK